MTNKKWLDGLRENDTVQVRWPWRSETHMAVVLPRSSTPTHYIHVRYVDVANSVSPEKLREESFHPVTGTSVLAFAYIESVGAPVEARRP